MEGDIPQSLKNRRLTSSFNERLRILCMKDCRFFNFERLRNLSERKIMQSFGKLKNPAIFHTKNTQSFIERTPFFRHVRLPKSFKSKEPSVLSRVFSDSVTKNHSPLNPKSPYR